MMTNNYQTSINFIMYNNHCPRIKATIEEPQLENVDRKACKMFKIEH